jgi:hypothetical protein
MLDLFVNTRVFVILMVATYILMIVFFVKLYFFKRDITIRLRPEFDLSDSDRFQMLRAAEERQASGVVPVGGRNNWLHLRLLEATRDIDLTTNEIWNIGLVFSRKLESPLPQDEVWDIARAVSDDKKRRQPKGAIEPPPWANLGRDGNSANG